MANSRSRKLQVSLWLFLRKKNLYLVFPWGSGSTRSEKEKPGWLKPSVPWQFLDSLCLSGHNWNFCSDHHVNLINAMDAKATGLLLKIPAGSSNREIGTVRRKRRLRISPVLSLLHSSRIMGTSNPDLFQYTQKYWISKYIIQIKTRSKTQTTSLRKITIPEAEIDQIMMVFCGYWPNLVAELRIRKKNLQVWCFLKWKDGSQIS